MEELYRMTPKNHNDLTKGPNYIAPIVGLSDEELVQLEKLREEHLVKSTGFCVTKLKQLGYLK